MRWQARVEGGWMDGRETAFGMRFTRNQTEQSRQDLAFPPSALSPLLNVMAPSSPFMHSPMTHTHPPSRAAA